MLADRRLWRTGDGRLVQDGDADAAFLAYKAGDRLAAADEAKAPGAEDSEAEPQEKAAPRPANKARRPGANK